MGNIARFVGRFYATADFATYAQSMASRGTWKPSGITVHHTGAPSLAQRPYGFTAQHMLNIKWGYENDRGWSSGPHFFVDQNGIWVFVDPCYPGIHAASFNDTHHGVEMLGDYDVEFVNASVLANAASCIKSCMDAWGYKAFNFHRDDRLTNKTCPGRRVTRELINEALRDVVQNVHPKVIRGNDEFCETLLINNRVYVPARSFSNWVGIPKSYLYYGEDGLHIDGVPVSDETIVGQVCWAPLTEMAKHAGMSVLWDSKTKTARLNEGT